MAVRAAVPFLVAMMLVTGVCNTLLTKYQVGHLLLTFQNTVEALEAPGDNSANITSM